jgi:CheY-like chemotaxis protein
LISIKVKKLIVVEDDKSTAIGIKKLVGNSDVTTKIVSYGEEAIKELGSTSYDCMILDLKLADISGFEVLKRLDELKIRIPPVIIYSGKDLTRDEENSLQEYASSIIVKGERSDERLLDESALFLHRVVENLPARKKKVIKDIYDEDPVFRDKKVLIADDDMRNVYALSKILADRGMTVVKAVNGQKALEALESEPDVDLVLMDIMMPIMDGIETMKKIRAQANFKDLPIIAVTAKAMKGDREKCIEAGANDYIFKPVEINRLLTMLRVWLHRK